MTSPPSSIIRVKLVKQPRYGLGFLIRQRSKSPHVIVSDLVSGGMAAESGLVQIGDIILKVNETDLNEITYEESVKFLKLLPINSMAVLILKGPEGYTSHLETRFTNDGTPRTIRVTKPIISPDSFMERIKKTFINSSSPKPCQSKQTQANCDSPVSHVNGIQNIVNGTSVNGSIKSRLLMNGNHVCDSKTQGKNVKNEKKSLSPFTDENCCITEDITNDVNENDTLAKVQVANSLGDYNTSYVISNNSFCVHNGTNSKSKKDENRIKINNIHPGQKGEIIQSSVLHEGQTNNVDSNEISESLTMIARASDSRLGFASPSLSRGCDVGRSKSHGSRSKSPVNISVQSESTSNKNSSVYSNGINYSDIDGKGVNGNRSKVMDVNRLTDRRPSSPTFRKGSLKKFVKLRNVGDERPVCSDTLHQKASEVIKKNLYFIK